MKPVYISSITGNEVSRQRFRQIENSDAGMCQFHKDRPATTRKGMCDECISREQVRRDVKKPHTPKALWDAVDFSIQPKLIAEKFGVDVRAVYAQRIKRGLRHMKRNRISKRTLNAAAYDLLTSLQAVVKICDRDTVEFTDAKAAITKVTGQPFEGAA